MKKGLIILLILFIVFIILFVFLYYIFSAESRFNHRYTSPIEESSNNKAKKELPFIDDYLDTNDEVVKVSEYKNPLNKNNNIINISRKTKIKGFDKVYTLENLSTGIGQVVDYGAVPKAIGHKIAGIGQTIAFAYIYETNNYNDEELNYNYLGLMKYSSENHPTDENVRDYLLLRTKRDIEIINLLPKKNEFVLFYAVKMKPRSYELIGRKEIFMQKLRLNSEGTLDIDKPQKVMMPDYLSLYELRVLNENEGYTMIYRARISQQRGRIDIIISKMDDEANIYYSTDVPVEIPRGVFNNFETAKTHNDDIDTYTIAFSYTDLALNKSSVVLLLFDRDGNLNPVPYVKIDPYKAESDVPKNINLIESNGIFFIFYNYADYGYFISGVNTEGNFVLASSRIAEPDSRYENISAIAYKDRIIVLIGNQIKIYNSSDESGLSSDYVSHRFNSTKLLSKRDTKTDLCLYENGLALVWVRDILSRDISYTGLLSFNKLFKR